MLEVNQLTRNYGSFKAVDNVSFNMCKGEIVGLLGHNGAGKTTIMKMISGYLEPDQGEIYVDGINLADNPEKIQLNLGYLPENLPVYPEMQVVDYLDYAADLKGLKGQLKKDEIKRVIKETDIAKKLLAPVSTLSRGYKQRVGVAQAIMGQPKLLILDEPTNGLDPEQTRRMRNLLHKVAKRSTVILSTHIMQEVDALCSRVLILRDGQLAVDEQLNTLRQSNHLLLESSLPESAIDVLQSLEPVASIHLLEVKEEKESFIYRISLKEETDAHAFSAEIAHTIIQSDFKLYRLLPEQRDLETLFREVNEAKYTSEDLSHAA